MKRLDRPFFRSHFRLASFYARYITRRRFWFAAFLVGLLATADRHSRTQQADTTTGRFGEREDDVQAGADKIGGNLFEVSIRLLVSGPTHMQRAAHTKLRTMKGAFGAFTKSRLATFRMSAIRCSTPRREPTFLLSHEELATLFHPATQSVGTARLATTPFTELEAPACIPSGKGSGEVLLGQVKHGNDTRLVGVM